MANLQTLWDRRDAIDHREGLMAFRRYRRVMAAFADHYGFPLKHVTSAFVALSPNSDYHGNLRSLASVLSGVRENIPTDDITVSTYKACRNRAVSYVTGERNFLKTVKGPKIRAFRDNILRPNTSPEVTVDGHMVAAWAGKAMTMKQAAYILKGPSDYRKIADGIRTIATRNEVAPCQAQAILWLTRKRIFGVKYSAQLELFAAQNDSAKTLCHPRDYPPYERKTA